MTRHEDGPARWQGCDAAMPRGAHGSGSGPARWGRSQAALGDWRPWSSGPTRSPRRLVGACLVAAAVAGGGVVGLLAHGDVKATTVATFVMPSGRTAKVVFRRDGQ